MNHPQTAQATRPPTFTIWPFWKCVRIGAGLEDVRVHDLRHTFALQAALMGHSLIEI